MGFMQMTMAEDEQKANCTRFIEKATAVSAVVTSIRNIDEAFDYCIALCGNRDSSKTGFPVPIGAPAAATEASRKDQQEKIVAAPGLAPQHYAALSERCHEMGLTCIDSGMRDHLDGVNIGFTWADLGIAETGTLVVHCPGEELRLATMLCEYHICLLSCSRIVSDAFAAEQQLLQHFSTLLDYTAFITGASRTADIERVLALGVHGPLELHILLLED